MAASVFLFHSTPLLAPRFTLPPRHLLTISNQINQGLQDYFRLVSETLKRIDQETECDDGSRLIELNELRSVILCGQGTTSLNNIFDAQAKVDAATRNLEARNKELFELERSIEENRSALKQKEDDLVRDLDAQRRVLEQDKVDLQILKHAFLDAQAISTETRDTISKTETALAGIMAAQSKFGSDLGTLLKASNEMASPRKRARTQDSIEVYRVQLPPKVVAFQEKRLEHLTWFAGAAVIIEGSLWYRKSNIETGICIMNLISSNGKWIESYHAFCRSENGLEHTVAYCFYAILQSDRNTPWILGGGCHCPQHRFPWSSEGGNCIGIIKMDAAESYGTIMLVFDDVKSH
ncbi:hypothetical protein QC764_101442 [Podospora pseudoanserina]|uniref:Uncharacterized protein n=1 Tax=Podospora pseudoanserina TaxID=2609844 RepID=A0ABR0IKL6_9PEZI|nr:hypothetical protein QC764_101442 [Podospora pseudoanserina]